MLNITCDIDIYHVIYGKYLTLLLDSFPGCSSHMGAICNAGRYLTRFRVHSKMGCCCMPSSTTWKELIDSRPTKLCSAARRLAGYWGSMGSKGLNRPATQSRAPSSNQLRFEFWALAMTCLGHLWRNCSSSHPLRLQHLAPEGLQPRVVQILIGTRNPAPDACDCGPSATAQASEG